MSDYTKIETKINNYNVIIEIESNGVSIHIEGFASPDAPNETMFIDLFGEPEVHVPTSLGDSSEDSWHRVKLACKTTLPRHVAGIEIVEGINGYYLYHKEESTCLGDGVDMFDGVPPGTTEFNWWLITDVIDNYDSYIEAFFSQKAEMK